MPITVHIVFNAHLDPIWLWPWTAGMDAAVATCRSACDRLDAHPDVRFSRGEAWVYQLIERIDPALFERIKAHIAAGRWEIVGGWWVQPDCNLPTGEGFRQQIRRGQDYFRRAFGSAPTIGYNVDSFGHAATLPRLMTEAGQDGYVMMRPGAHEKELPARLFRWQGEPGGPELLTYRLAGYASGRQVSADYVRASLTDLPPGIEHTMLFCGLGDHGGGPTETQIAWLREHEHAFDGARLVFSTVQAFFDAVRPQAASCPLVEGDLQHHAIGCYTVHRGVKTAVTRADHRLRQLALVRPNEPGLEEAWRTVCLHQFHDTLGGTCLPSAYGVVLDQLGGVAAWADTELNLAARQHCADAPPCPRQRLIVWNPGEATFDGFLRHEVWTEGGWKREWRFADEAGAVVPHQLVDSEAVVWASGMQAVLAPVKLASGAWQTLELHTDAAESTTTPAAGVWASESAVAAQDGPVVSYRTAPGLGWPGGVKLPAPQLALLNDPTDTWSHGIDRYASVPLETAQWGAPRLLEDGPLRATVQIPGHIGQSPLVAEWRVYAGQPYAELELIVDWREQHRLLKLMLTPPEPFATRCDGIPGGHLARELDGAERPIQDFAQLTTTGGLTYGVVCPNVYALSATPSAASFTLLRSPVLAHHEPHPGQSARGQHSDQGRNVFLLRFLGGRSGSVDLLAGLAQQMQQPLVVVSVTNGMPSWPEAAKF
ncbi:MAG: hypothetical protein HZB16_15265 [Armatimonadetes bacterium]|nr:hypothetical protein [Armatimonadota bacterium]